MLSLTLSLTYIIQKNISMKERTNERKTNRGNELKSRNGERKQRRKEEKQRRKIKAEKVSVGGRLITSGVAFA